MSAARHLGQQLQLFDTSSVRGRTPGEISFEEWREHPDVKYHGTFRSDWENNPVQHFGTLGQATERLHFSAARFKAEPSHYQRNYYSGESYEDNDHAYDLDDEQTTHVGRVYARKLPPAASFGSPDRTVVSDKSANRADMAYRAKQGYEKWEMPASVVESAGFVRAYPDPAVLHEHLVSGDDDVHTAFEALEAGKRVDYANEGEANSVFESKRNFAGAPSVPSSIVARGNTSSWEREQLADPNASTMRKSFAQQRIESGQEGAVPFERPEPAGYYQSTLPGNTYRKVIKPPIEERRNLSKLQFTTGGDE